VRGGALLVANHVSLVDALLIIASNERPVRFFMQKQIYENPLVKIFARMGGVIPIPNSTRPEEMMQAFEAAADAIRRGDLVCVFPEGEISRSGEIGEFSGSFAHILRDVDAPIIPTCLDGVWGSIFSFAEGKIIWKWPRQFPYHVSVHIGAPISP